VAAIDGLIPAPQAAAVPQDINLLDLMRSLGDASTRIVTAAELASAPALRPRWVEILERIWQGSGIPGDDPPRSRHRVCLA
jgi:hypothetical protein